MEKNVHIYTPQTLISPHTNRPIYSDVMEAKMRVYWCSVCFKRLGSPITAHQHLSGQPHKKQVQDGNKEAVPLRQKRELNTRQPHKKQVQDGNKEGVPLRQKRELNTTNVSSDPVVREPLNKKKKKKKEEPQDTTNVSSDTVVKEPVSKKKKKKEEEPPESKVSDPNLVCADCNLVFNTLHDTIQHFKHTKHLLDATKKKTNGQAVPQDGTAREKCEVCNIFVSILCVKAHYQGKRHAKAVHAMETAKEREILDNWQSRKPTVLSNKGRGNAMKAGRGFAKSIGSQQSKIIPGFVRASDPSPIGSHQAAIAQPNRTTLLSPPDPSNNYSTTTAFVRPLTNNFSPNPTYGPKDDVPVNMSDNTRHSNIKNNFIPSGDMYQNTPYSTPAPHQSHPVQSKETSGYQATSKEYLPPNIESSSSNANKYEQSNYNYRSNGASNTPSMQGANSYYSYQTPYTASYSTPTATSNYNHSANENYYGSGY